ncbi:MAG TPA: hypothetical protein VGB94_08595 [Acidobacteriaceae bacterium]
MTNRFSGNRVIVLIFWVLAFAAIPFWTHIDTPAWDMDIYRAGLHSLRAGHDPYADGMAVQRDFHAHLAEHPTAAPPYTYVYSPITLPLLRLLGSIPAPLITGLYWLLYMAGILAQIWVVMQATKPEEWKYFEFLAPVAAFFPGLLVLDVALSGNVAYICYGLLFATALLGWRRGQWFWFYVAIVIASCFKGPFLSLLAIPVLSARRQWVPAGVTGVIGVSLFAMQPYVWPELFRSYLQAVELQFSYNRDFGVSPAGIFGRVITYMGHSYSPACTIFYLLYVIPLFGLLLYFSREFLKGKFSLEQWMPVLLMGVILLNPRIMPYDIAPMSLPMALMGWRFLRAYTSVGKTITILGVFFVVTNAVALGNPDSNRIDLWKFIEGFEIVLFFAAGCWNLLRRQNENVAVPARTAMG